jgi:hypothetical protein
MLRRLLFAAAGVVTVLAVLVALGRYRLAATILVFASIAGFAIAAVLLRFWATSGCNEPPVSASDEREKRTDRPHAA